MGSLVCICGWQTESALFFFWGGGYWQVTKDLLNLHNKYLQCMVA